VSLVVSSLDLHKATGSDGLSTRFIRISLYMVRLITVLLNKCIDSSLFPYQWKQVIVTPVPKCKQCTGLSQFQPISVLPVLSKVLERIMYNQIVSHLHKYKYKSYHKTQTRYLIVLKFGTQHDSVCVHLGIKFGCNIINGHKVINNYSRIITQICCHTYRVNH